MLFATAEISDSVALLEALLPVDAMLMFRSGGGFLEGMSRTDPYRGRGWIAFGRMVGDTSAPAATLPFWIRLGACGIPDHNLARSRR